MFNLPKSTEVKKVIPKNAFDAFTNTKQKKVFTEAILRMVWQNKLATDTTNLPFKEVREIQVFDIELKFKAELKDVLAIIDKAIPYPIIFIVRFKDMAYVSTSPKHQNPNNENTSVIDYTFSSQWVKTYDLNYKIELKTSLDLVYNKFCEQFVDSNLRQLKNISDLIDQQKQRDFLHNEIEKLKSAIAKCKQFNKKVELNLELKLLEADFSRVVN